MSRTVSRHTGKSINVTGRHPFDVTFRDFTAAKGKRVVKVWAASPTEAYKIGRLAAFAEGLLPEVLDLKQRKLTFAGRS